METTYNRYELEQGICTSCGDDTDAILISDGRCLDCIEEEKFINNTWELFNKDKADEITREGQMNLEIIQEHLKDIIMNKCCEKEYDVRKSLGDSTASIWKCDECGTINGFTFIQNIVEEISECNDVPINQAWEVAFNFYNNKVQEYKDKGEIYYDEDYLGRDLTDKFLK